MSSKFKAKLLGELGETVAQPAPNINDGVLKNLPMVVPLKYPSNFWRSIECH